MDFDFDVSLDFQSMIEETKDSFDSVFQIY